jgi:hypothetical protein
MKRFYTKFNTILNDNIETSYEESPEHNERMTTLAKQVREIGSRIEGEDGTKLIEIAQKILSEYE